MDVKAEEVVLDSLKILKIPLQVFSEEHGTVTYGNEPEHTVILDGLDGSGEYREKRGDSMYGTMVSVLEGDDPTYDDYLVSGIMIHSPKPELLLAVKGEGCFKVDIETGEPVRLERKQTGELSEESIIDLDINWPILSNVFENPENKTRFPLMQCAYRSQAARTALFINEAIDAQLEVTRKGNVSLMGNLEMAPTYGLVMELGGVMVVADGTSLGTRKYKSFAQHGINVPVVVAPNREFANGIITELSLNAA
ncbi:MAG TPA: hypothetical protein VM077_01705 [Candidatus Limnocylindrales bacterium]|nr:hypothetical protein [Candidatus Limnocylindrales bacterium]